MKPEEQILTKVLNCRRSDLHRAEKAMNDDDRALAAQMFERLESGEPLQYILGDVYFYNVDLKVNEDVLIPRFETELLVERVVQAYQGQKDITILDIGTGSGCIAIALAKALPHTRLFAIDVSKKAIALAKENAMLNGVNSQIAFVCEDMRIFLEEHSGKIPVFDCIISNPPYIATKELECLPLDVQREPMSALDGGPDGSLYYHIIAKHLPRWLKEGGMCFFEIGETQAPILESIFKNNSVSWQTHVWPDYTDADRIFQAHWVKANG